MTVLTNSYRYVQGQGQRATLMQVRVDATTLL